MAGDEVAPRARHLPQKRIRWDRYRGLPEVFVTSDALARTLTGVGAVVMLVGTVLWGVEAWDRFEVPEIVRPAWFRVPQFALALAGIVVAAIEIAYLSYFTAWGIIWRRWRGVTIAFAVVSGVWTAVWLIDRFVLDSVFIG